MKNQKMQSKTDKNINIAKTLKEKAPEVSRQIESFQKEQKKYKEFLKKQPHNQYNYIETQTFSTI